MSRTTTACLKTMTALLALVYAAGCAPGSVSPNGGADADLIQDPPSQVDCTAELAITGSFAVEGTPDEGCYPLGTWTVVASVADQGDCATVPLAGEYVYSITEEPETGLWIVTFPADAQNPNIDLKVSGEGGGCSGSFVHISADGLEYLVLKPYLDEGVISGSGTFELYKESQI